MDGNGVPGDNWETEPAPPKSVQEMSAAGVEPPKEYICRDNKFSQLDTSPPLAPIPVIDLSLFSSGGEEEGELEKLRSALSSWGCFQAAGHGMPSHFLDEVREVIQEFFKLPGEEKSKYSRAAGESEGYGQDKVVSKKQVLDWCDRLSLRIYPKDQRKPKLWPEKPEDFREKIVEFAADIKSVMGIIFKAMARSLKLEVDSFSKQFGERAIMQGRFILYPPCPTPDQVFGLKAHSDRSGMTVLLQDREVQGLQVLKDDKWLTVPIIPYALFVNLGDQMQIMSNGIFKSPMHRVVTNPERGKITVAIFNEPEPEPEPENEIGPVESLVDEKRPRLYKSVKNYANFNYECFQKGLVALDAAKI
ncbi:protein SRG1-like isoform X1 [Diospyros lotus]|uniref:protein SRG1-like isoform X1 n=1 Tax=Diospyros lotus TaxID=55363 RepID=UPI00225752C0|nr:protein SRG1-like isoform X1 [Diospyros lotus]